MEQAPRPSPEEPVRPPRTGTREVARCLDCEAPLAGEYCHACGQRTRSPIQPAPVLVADLARELLEVDHRVVRSLRALLLRPGHLTLEYLAGHRRRWTSPLRLYLMATVVYFLVAGWTGATSFLFITATDETSRIVEWFPRILAVVVPAFALFDHLLVGRRRLWAASLIFSLHLHAGWFLLATVTALGQPLLPGPGEGWRWYDVAMAVPVAVSQIAVWVYAWMALRRFHGRGWWATSWRMLTLIVLHSVLTGGILFGLFTVLG